MGIEALAPASVFTIVLSCLESTIFIVILYELKGLSSAGPNTLNFMDLNIKTKKFSAQESNALFLDKEPLQVPNLTG